MLRNKDESQLGVSSCELSEQVVDIGVPTGFASIMLPFCKIS